jgi:nucleoside-diphosphate-sugar epimerase
MGIVVIGGSGFIGTRLCHRINSTSSSDFEIIDKEPSTSFPYKAKQVDICQLKDLQISIKNASVIVNLAAEHRDDVRPISLYDRVNVEGAKNICQIARENNINKIIFTSSVAVYGFAESGTNESGKISPFNDYGRTKWEAEKVYLSWQAEDPSRALVIIRPTVVFGERNRGNVFNLLKQVAS